MLAPDGGVKLMDFGIARLPDGVRTKTGLVLGSPSYIAPEGIVGKPVDGRSDIFALGVALYEMLTGVVPFRRPDVTAVLYSIVNDIARAAEPAQPSRAGGVRADPGKSARQASRRPLPGRRGVRARACRLAQPAAADRRGVGGASRRRGSHARAAVSEAGLAEGA